MSERLHVRKLNRIEYGTGLFSTGDGTYDDTMDLLREVSSNVWTSEDETSLEIPKADLRNGIKKLRRMSETTFRKKHPSLAKVGYTVKRATDHLQSFLEEADPEGDTVALDWF